MSKTFFNQLFAPPLSQQPLDLSTSPLSAYTFFNPLLQYYDLCATFRSNYEKFFFTPNVQVIAPPRKSIGSFCRCDAECEFGVENSSCDGGRCACDENFEGFPGARQCTPVDVWPPKRAQQWPIGVPIRQGGGPGEILPFTK
ncbi:unnamed protein product, partial [Cyprideis torosa]